MKKIEAYTSYDERNKVRYSKVFEIVENSDVKEIAKEHSLFKVAIDVEQGRDEVYDYDYYKYEVKDEDGDVSVHYIAMPTYEFDAHLTNNLVLKAESLASRYNFDEYDIERGLEGIAYDAYFFLTKEWDGISSSFKNETLDNFYAEFRKDSYEYDRSCAIKKLEDLLEETASKIRKEIESESKDYYNF